MNGKCLAGIHKKTGVVEVIANLNLLFLGDHLAEIERENCYAVVADAELAKAAWGTKINSPLDIVKKQPTITRTTG